MRTLKEIKALYDTKQPSKEKGKTQTPGLEIKSADEKRFADKHVIQKIADRNGNGDDVFNATNVKGVERSPKHGYNPGEDQKVYEEVEIDEASKGPMDPEKKAKSAIDTILKNHEEPAPEKGMKIGEEKDDDKMEPSTKHVKAALKVRAKPELETKDVKSYHRNILNKDLKEAEKEDVPFKGPYDKPAKKQSGQKSDPGYSTARHLARQAMQKMLDKKEKMKEEVELDEGDVIPFPEKKKEEKPDTKPGWMLRKYPELAKKLEDAKARVKARKEVATQKEEAEIEETTAWKKRGINVYFPRSFPSRLDPLQVRQTMQNSVKAISKTDPEFSKQLPTKKLMKMFPLKNEEVELHEARKLIKAYTSGAHGAKVYKNPETGEHEVDFFKHGKNLGEGPRYYTNDANDAHATAKSHINNMSTQKEQVELDEVLKPSMGVKAYIDDFIKSDDPRFKGASKKERMKRALAAYYAAKRGD